MPQVLCALDERRESARAVSSAIDFCRERDAQLTLVGVVRPLRAVAQPAHGELVRRFGDVQFRLLEAARAARASGLSAQLVFRAGDPGTEALRAAKAVGAEHVFLANRRSRLRAALTRKPEVTVTHVAVPAHRVEGPRRLRAVA